MIQLIKKSRKGRYFFEERSVKLLVVSVYFR